MELIAKLAEPLSAWLGPGLFGLLLLGAAIYKSNYSQTATEFNQILEQRKQMGVEFATRIEQLTKENMAQRERLTTLEAQYSALWAGLEGMRRYARHIRHRAVNLFQVYYSAGRLGVSPPQEQLPAVPKGEELSEWQAPDMISPDDLMTKIEKDAENG